MANVSALKAIWERTDSSYIQAAKYGNKANASPKGFPETKTESNRPYKGLHKFEEDDTSEDGYKDASLKNFDAIPEEFRPSKQGKDLLTVMTPSKKLGSKEPGIAKEPPQNVRCPIKSNESYRNEDSRSSNSCRNERYARKPNKSLNTDNSNLQQQNIDRISYETEKSSGMFFFDCSSRNKSTTKAADKCEKTKSARENRLSEWPEKSKSKMSKDENSQGKFFNLNSCQRKADDYFEIRPPFPKNKDNIKLQELNKNSFQSSNANKNKIWLEKNGVQEIRRETTVTKRIQWKNDLCGIKKPENKPNLFYEYTKTTKKSMSRASSHSDDDEATKRQYQNIKTERYKHQYVGSRHQNNEPMQPYQNRNHKVLNYNKETQKIPRNPIYKFEDEHCFKGKDSIIVRHKIEVLHVNEQGKTNRMFQKSHQATHPPKRDGNGNIQYKGYKPRYIKTMEKTGNNTKPKTAEDLKETEKKVKAPLKPTDSSSEAVQATCVVSPTSNNYSEEDAATLIEYGREMSNLIAGSHIAVNEFLYNYEQWKDIRRVTMLLFEEFEKTLSQSCNKNKKIIDVAEMVGTGCKMVQFVPHPGVNAAARVVAFLSDIILRMFSSSKSAKNVSLDDFQLRLCLQNDMEVTSDIYAYGLQCDLQFQDTCKYIEEFHCKIKDGSFGKYVETFETGFLKEISLLNPNYPEVFYKRLERFYKFLNNRQQSEEGKSFCEAFEDWPDALTTIGHLPKRFKTQNWDSSPVLNTWEEIYNLLQNDQSVVEDVLKKIQDCICVLTKEQNIVEKYVMDLQRRI